MAEMGQGDPLPDTISATCAVDLRTELPKNGDKSGKSTHNAKLSTPRSRPVHFYLGLAGTLVGITGFLVGAFSSKWVVVLGGATTDKTLSQGARYRMLAHLGPWRACNHGGHCGAPWLVASGLTEWSVKGLQALTLLSTFAYVGGVIVIVVQMLRPRWTFVYCKRLLTEAVPEGFILVAAVLGFLSILLMGHLKQNLMLQMNQRASPGWGLALILVSVLFTVISSCAMVFYRHLVVGDSALLLHLLRAGLWRLITGKDWRYGRRKKRRRRKSRRRTHGVLLPGVSLSESNIRVAVIDSTVSEGGADLQHPSEGDVREHGGDGRCHDAGDVGAAANGCVDSGADSNRGAKFAAGGSFALLQGMALLPRDGNLLKEPFEGRSHCAAIIDQMRTPFEGTSFTTTGWSQDNPRYLDGGRCIEDDSKARGNYEYSNHTTSTSPRQRKINHSQSAASRQIESCPDWCESHPIPAFGSVDSASGQSFNGLPLPLEREKTADMVGCGIDHESLNMWRRGQPAIVSVQTVEPEADNTYTVGELTF